MVWNEQSLQMAWCASLFAALVRHFASVQQKAAKNSDHTQKETWKYSSWENRKLILVNFWNDMVAS